MANKLLEAKMGPGPSKTKVKLIGGSLKGLTDISEGKGITSYSPSGSTTKYKSEDKNYILKIKRDNSNNQVKIKQKRSLKGMFNKS